MAFACNTPWFKEILCEIILGVRPGLFYIRAFVPLFAVITHNSFLIYQRVEFVQDVRVRDWVPCINGEILNVVDDLDDLKKGAVQIPLLLEPLLVIIDHEHVDHSALDGILNHVLCMHHLKSLMIAPDNGQIPPWECILHLIIKSCLQVLPLSPISKGFVLLAEGVPRYDGYCARCNNQRHAWIRGSHVV